jgi:hypothetical protein
MQPKHDPVVRETFQRALETLARNRVPYVIGGAFALNHYTGIWRDTKDLDVFCRPEHADACLAALAGAGFATMVEERHWLGKARHDSALVDVIWGGGNWATFVDDHWFEHAERGRVAGLDVPVASPGDIILSKAWVAGRERYDGADIVHLLHARGRALDWDDLVARFGDAWPLLLHYLVLYRFVYPAERDRVPAELVRRLAARVGTGDELADGLEFRGPLVDRYAYLHDLRYEGRPDPREEIAVRSGHDPAAVVLRRQLDTEAFDEGLPYRPHGASSPEDNYKVSCNGKKAQPAASADASAASRSSSAATSPE